MLYSIPEKKGSNPYWSFEKTSLRPDTNQRVVDIYEKKEATREDLKDWFYNRWGKARLDVLTSLAPSKHVSKFSNIINGINQQEKLPYYLSTSIFSMYQTLVWDKIENIESIENIVPKLYNLLSPSRTMSWCMGIVEFKEWYNSSDELWKTGKDYVLDGIRLNFSVIWKQSIAELNKKRKLQGKGILNNTRATMISHVWGSSPISLSEFLALLEEDTEEIQKILELEQQVKKQQRERLNEAQRNRDQKKWAELTEESCPKKNWINVLTTGMYNMFKTPTKNSHSQS